MHKSDIYEINIISLDLLVGRVDKFPASIQVENLLQLSPYFRFSAHGLKFNSVKRN